MIEYTVYTGMRLRCHMEAPSMNSTWCAVMLKDIAVTLEANMRAHCKMLKQLPLLKVRVETVEVLGDA